MFENGNDQDLPICLPGFEHIKRYKDPRQNNEVVAKILPGEYYVTRKGGMITTVLGSCVSVCIYDLDNSIGGMNHFMLPDLDKSKKWNETDVNDSARYGNYAMESLINEIMKYGGKRGNLRAKVFGGGKIMSDMVDIGCRNIAFTLDFLQKERIKICAEDVGDIFPRKVNFFPVTGKVMMKKLKSLQNDTLIQREHSYQSKIEVAPIVGDVELF